jgi:hypothetical protein
MKHRYCLAFVIPRCCLLVDPPKQKKIIRARTTNHSYIIYHDEVYLPWPVRFHLASNLMSLGQRRLCAKEEITKICSGSSLKLEFII